MTIHIPFDNSYARLPERFYAHVNPTPVPTPRLIRVNAPLAERLGIDPAELASPECVEVLAGNGSVKNLGRYAVSWIAWWLNRPSSTAALT